ncbi:MAG: NPCBM/NEW2 domain-containing protein [Bacteroidaceae bacterium]|nr:NPCBM/NEW2 domain-containing protein [Bacteroidaceae bacterium]
MKLRFLFAVTLMALQGLCFAAWAQSTEIQLSTDKLEFDGNASTKEVKILKGKNYMLFSAADWMACTEKKGGVLEISVKPYQFFYPREASVILTSKKTNYSKVLTVRQTDGLNRPAVKTKPSGSGMLFLMDMDLSKSKPFFMKEIGKNKSADGHAVKLKGSAYESAIETHAPTALHFRLNGAKRFLAEVGIDDEIMTRNETTIHGHASYEALVDGKVVKQGSFNLLDPEAVQIDVNTEGGKFFTLRFLEGESTYGDHIALGNARFEVNGEKPVMVTEEEMKEPEPAPVTASACPGCSAECKDCALGCKECKACRTNCKETCKNCKADRHSKAKATAPAIHKYTKAPVKQVK